MSVIESEFHRGAMQRLTEQELHEKAIAWTSKAVEIKLAELRAQVLRGELDPVKTKQLYDLVPQLIHQQAGYLVLLNWLGVDPIPPQGDTEDVVHYKARLKEQAPRTLAIVPRQPAVRRK